MLPATGRLDLRLQLLSGFLFYLRKVLGQVIRTVFQLGGYEELPYSEMRKLGKLLPVTVVHLNVILGVPGTPYLYRQDAHRSPFPSRKQEVIQAPLTSNSHSISGKSFGRMCLFEILPARCMDG